MAIYHLSAKIISRSNGGSVVAAAAYRSAEKLYNNLTGESYNYTRKQSVDYTEIFLPDNAPKEFYNRGILWNSVEENEKQKNAQLAREIDFALPIELSFEQQKTLAREFAKTFSEAGMCVDLSFHNKKNNPHCHLLLTLRGIDKNGKWLPKCKKVNNKRVNLNNWNDKETLEKWRVLWQNLANNALQKAGLETQIDSRSYIKQNIDKIPTIHLGKSATAIERKNQNSDRGDFNRNIKKLNDLKLVEQKLKNYSDCLKKVPATNDPRHFWLWLILTRKKVAEEEQLQKELLAKSKLDLLTKADNEKFQNQINSLLTQIAIEKQRLTETNEQDLLHSEEFQNFAKAQADLQLTEKNRDNYKLTWDLLYNQISNLPKDNPDYDSKLQEYTKAGDEYRSAVLQIDQQKKQLDSAEKILNQKRDSLPTSNAVIAELQNKITQLHFQSTQKIAEFEKKQNAELNAILLDSAYLQKIRSNFIAKMKRTTDPLFAKSGETNYYQFLLKYSKPLKLDISKFDTSAKFIRQLRLAEQETQKPDFLDKLNLATESNAVPIIARLSSEDAFDVDFNLADALTKDKIKKNVSRFI